MKNIQVFFGDNTRDPSRLNVLPVPPDWRDFRNKRNITERAEHYDASQEEIDMVNAALILRRPLLITGPPGVGKSSLAYAVANELGLEDVLVWPITSKSTLQHGLYNYDALARLSDAAPNRTPNGDSATNDQQLKEDPLDIGRYITLGPVGTAFLKSDAKRPSVVLIDEIDKGDIDLPNDLLHLFEEGEFPIHELARLRPSEEADQHQVDVFGHSASEILSVPRNGLVRCTAFPLVFMTSNGEREFPPAFLRRCLQLQVRRPDRAKLSKIVQGHLGLSVPDEQTEHQSDEENDIARIVSRFLTIRDEEKKEMATDQLLNALYLLKSGVSWSEKETLHKAILSALSDVQDVPDDRETN